MPRILSVTRLFALILLSILSSASCSSSSDSIRSTRDQAPRASESDRATLSLTWLDSMYQDAFTPEFARQLPSDIKTFYGGEFKISRNARFLPRKNPQDYLTSKYAPDTQVQIADHTRNVRLLANFFVDEDGERTITFCTAYSLNVLVVTAAHCLRSPSLTYQYSIAITWALEDADLLELRSGILQKAQNKWFHLSPVEISGTFDRKGRFGVNGILPSYFKWTDTYGETDFWNPKEKQDYAILTYLNSNAVPWTTDKDTYQLDYRKGGEFNSLRTWSDRVDDIFENEAWVKKRSSSFDRVEDGRSTKTYDFLGRKVDEGVEFLGRQYPDALLSTSQVVLVSHSGGLPLSYVPCNIMSSENGLLRHDCRSYSGSSGGPLIDQLTGKVIGFNIGGGRAVSIANIESWQGSGGSLTMSRVIEYIKYIEQNLPTDLRFVGEEKEMWGRYFKEFDD